MKKRPITALAGVSLGTMTGELFYHNVLGIGFKAALATATPGVLLLAATPFLIGMVPLYKIGKQIINKYDRNDPFMLFSAHFLLFSSYMVLSYVSRLMIMAAFMSTVNPFTLPIMIAAGASASIMLGLYLLTRPTHRRESGLEGSIADSSCSFFPCFPTAPKKHRPYKLWDNGGSDSDEYDENQMTEMEDTRQKSSYTN